MKNEIAEKIKLVKKQIGYKNTKIGLIPDDWEAVGINECSKDIFLGLTAKVDYVESGGFPLVRAKDMTNHGLDFSDAKFISEEQHRQLTKYRRAEKGDILVSKSGTLGTCCIVDVDREFSIYESIIVIKSDYEKLLSEYLLYLLQDEGVQLRMMGARVGGTVGHLNLKHFRELKLPLPLLSEQKKIAEILSTWDKAIELKEQLIEEKKQQKKGLMKKLLTGEIRRPGFVDEWKEVVISQIAKVSIGLVTTMTTNYVEHGVLLIRNSDIIENGFKEDGLIYLDSKFAESNESRRLKSGDIVTIHTGDVGVSAVIDGKFDGAIGFATINTRIYDNTKWCSQFISYYFNSDKYKNFALKMSTGDGRNNFNLKDFKDSMVPSICYDEQTEIVKILDVASTELNLIKKELAALKLQKKGLMQLLLTGIIRVQC